jgi:ketosteroid isomerase-like protein
MKKIYRVFLIVIPVIVFLSCSNEHTSNKKMANDEANIEDQKKEIKNTLTQMWDAIENEDMQLYASFIHSDFTQFGETDSILNVGKEAEVNGIKNWIKNSSNIHTEMIDPLVTVKENVAWIVYYWSDNGLTNGKPFASRGKSTRIFVKENGKWLCIHGHYTLLP